MAKDWQIARTASMKKVAGVLNLKFTETEEWGLRSRLEDFKLFNVGGKKQISNLMEKTDSFYDERLMVFDYEYLVAANNYTKWFYQTVFCVQSKALGLPHFLMKPENFFHKIGAFLGMQDIDFEENKEFSNLYLLKGEDENLIRHTMTDNVLKFFTIEKKWTLEGVGYFFIFYRLDELMPPEQVKNFYQKGLQLYEMLKQKEE